LRAKRTFSGILCFLPIFFSRMILSPRRMIEYVLLLGMEMCPRLRYGGIIALREEKPAYLKETHYDGTWLRRKQFSLFQSVLNFFSLFPSIASRKFSPADEGFLSEGGESLFFRKLVPPPQDPSAAAARTVFGSLPYDFCVIVVSS